MIDVPLGYCLVPVERLAPNDLCKHCFFFDFVSLRTADGLEVGCHNLFLCGGDRKDGKNVIFKLEKYPETDEEIIENVVEEMKDTLGAGDNRWLECKHLICDDMHHTCKMPICTSKDIYCPLRGDQT